MRKVGWSMAGDRVARLINLIVFQPLSRARMRRPKTAAKNGFGDKGRYPHRSMGLWVRNLATPPKFWATNQRDRFYELGHAKVFEIHRQCALPKAVANCLSGSGKEFQGQHL